MCTPLFLAPKVPSKTIMAAMLGIGSLVVFYLTLSAMAPPQERTPENSKVIVEWAPFELIAGTDERTLLQASEAFQQGFLDNQRGFIRRELLRGKDNHWVDLAYWESMADAERAAKNAANSPECHAYLNLMVAVDHDDPAAGVLFFEHIRIYPQKRIGFADRSANASASK